MKIEAGRVFRAFLLLLIPILSLLQHIVATKSLVTGSV